MNKRPCQKADVNQVSAAHSAADSHTIQAGGPKATTPKGRILALANDLNLSGSYGALLHMAAVMDSGTGPLVPNTEEERLTWDGHMRGLVSALHCVTLHEWQCAPDAAAEIVDSLLGQARSILRTVRPEREA